MAGWLSKALCSGHDWSSWHGIDYDPAYRRHMGKGLFPRSDWQTYSFPCHDFRKCGNCGGIEVRVEHHWGVAQHRSGTARSSVDDNTGHTTTWMEQRCVRSNCGVTQRCG